ncbi:hypothetical protein RB25_17910 [Herbaspirillum rubrisubalbicans]|uniref:recombinase family protein n=1 Tax=Herbaspirillum rubrisubalbicans TaxID=80842 RepID=UPI000DC56B45|nr:recombinase family protein [Herbaspirillum rubrisubalbicans]RAN45637.1 hypothetical protein RB25_17910 [Herbaspirillum rubrisubalbicans]
MLIYAYLRASTTEQDALRAADTLAKFVSEHGEPGQRIAHRFIENESGASLKRPELFKAIDACQPGDVLLVEQVDRLTRLNEADWLNLRALIDSRGIRLVALDVPTSWLALKNNDAVSPFVNVINRMLFDLLAVTARKDYEDRRRRSAEGIARAKEASPEKYAGRRADTQKHEDVRKALMRKDSWNDICRIHQVSRSTVARIARTLEAA